MKQNPKPRVSRYVCGLRAASNSALITRGGPFGFARTTPAARPAPRLAKALETAPERRDRHFRKSAGQPPACRWIRSRFGEGLPVPRPRGATSPPIAGKGNQGGWLVVTSRFHHNKTIVRDRRGAPVQTHDPNASSLNKSFSFLRKIPSRKPRHINRFHLDRPRHPESIKSPPRVALFHPSG
jgi:hypothetical protein